ncbi:hypothetical protein N9Y17_04970 [Gammaproteobacteria bacterium]|nr:hypothetical protein [Gammaproteobacteria bacterium]
MMCQQELFLLQCLSIKKMDSLVIQIGSQNAKQVVVLLHGLGADKHDLVPMAKWLLEQNPNLAFIMSQAPQRPVAYLDGLVANAWFDLPAKIEPKSAWDQAGMVQSFQAVDALFASMPDVTCRAVVGFSQGGALAALYGRWTELAINQVGVLSGFIPEVPWHQLARNDQHLSFFQSHGKQDGVVLLPAAQASKSLIQEKYPISYHEFDGAHEIPQSILEQLSGWLATSVCESG